MPTDSSGKLIIVSGPSGAGKTTVLRRVFESAPVPLVASVLATTRPPRPDEVDGVDYHFLSTGDFHARRKRGDFIECFPVFGHDCWYGTLLEEVTSGLADGKWVVLGIDVQGAGVVMERYPDAVSIFLCPSSVEEIERRLRDRRTETEEAIQRRLARAKEEIAFADQYRYRVVNNELDHAVREICDILTKESEADRDVR